MKKRLRHLPASLIATAVLLAVGVPVAWVVAGAAAAAGVLAGALLVAVNYLVSSLVVAWVDKTAREMLLVIVLTTYVLKFVVFGVVMWRVAAGEWAGLTAMGVTIIVATVVWTSAQLWWTLRAKIPYVDFDDG